MKAKSFDRKFDDGSDIATQLDLTTARRVTQEQGRASVDLPTWMIESLDQEAARLENWS